MTGCCCRPHRCRRNPGSNPVPLRSSLCCDRNRVPRCKPATCSSCRDNNRPHSNRARLGSYKWRRDRTRRCGNRVRRSTSRPVIDNRSLAYSSRHYRNARGKCMRRRGTGNRRSTSYRRRRALPRSSTSVLDSIGRCGKCTPDSIRSRRGSLRPSSGSDVIRKSLDRTPSQSSNLRRCCMSFSRIHSREPLACIVHRSRPRRSNLLSVRRRGRRRCTTRRRQWDPHHQERACTGCRIPPTPLRRNKREKRYESSKTLLPRVNPTLCDATRFTAIKPLSGLRPAV